MTLPPLLPLQRLALLIAIAGCLTQCAAPPPAPAKHDGTYWSAEAESDSPAKIVISIDEQHVGLFKNDKLVGLSPISSGREGHGTHPGNFKVTEKDEDHRSSLYGAFVDETDTIIQEDVDVRKDSSPPGTKFQGASMNWFMRFNGAIGMHQGYLPGYPASHGCIRLPGHMAELFYKATPHGSPVQVRSNGELLALRPAHAPSVRAPVTRNTSLGTAIASGLRPVTQDVPGAPPVRMTLAPVRYAPRTSLTPPPKTQYLPGYGPQR